MMLWIESTAHHLFNTPYRLLDWLLLKAESGESSAWPDTEAMFIDFVQSGGIGSIEVDVRSLHTQLAEGVQCCDAYIPDWWSRFFDQIEKSPMTDCLPPLLTMIRHLNWAWRYVDSETEIVSCREQVK